MIQFVILVLIGVIVVWLLRIVIKEGSARRRKPLPRSRQGLPDAEPGKPCPLCSTPLGRGETVHSVVYPGKTDKLVEIYGCPNCHPIRGAARAARVCPVCGQKLRERDYVVGRMFERPGQKKHLHVLGCTQCRKGA